MLMADVLKERIHDSSLLASDLPSFRRQESTFILLNLFVLAALLLIHTLFASFFGSPPRVLLIVLAAGALANIVELIWLQGLTHLSATAITVLTWAAIVLNMALATILVS